MDESCSSDEGRYIVYNESYENLGNPFMREIQRSYDEKDAAVDSYICKNPKSTFAKSRIFGT